MKIKDLKENIGVEGVSFAGKVKRVFDRKTGEGEYGPWSFQNIIVEDDTGDITVSLRNRNEIPTTTEGRRVAFNSKYVDSQKKNMGVKVVKEDYLTEAGEPREITKAVVTSSADIVWGEEYKPEPAVTTEQVQQVKEVSDEKQLILKKKDLMVEVLTFIAQASQYQALKPLAFSPMEWEKIATTLFIQLSR